MVSELSDELLEGDTEYKMGDIVSVVSGWAKGDGGRVICVHRGRGITLHVSRKDDTSFLVAADLVRKVEKESA